MRPSAIWRTWRCCGDDKGNSSKSINWPSSGETETICLSMVSSIEKWSRDSSLSLCRFKQGRLHRIRTHIEQSSLQSQTSRVLSSILKAKVLLYTKTCDVSKNQ